MARTTGNRRRRLVAALTFGLAWLGLSAPSRATGEGEWVVAPGVGYAVQRNDDSCYHGLGVFFDVDYGLTDVVGLRMAAR